MEVASKKIHRQTKDFYERPLDQEEAKFAADHIGIVWFYLNNRGLDWDEWFDTVIFRYMLAVKRYLSDPDLQRYKFTTIACSAMRAAIGHEHDRRKRRPQEVSLFDVVPGTESLTFEEIL
jgi:hypothetical protein